MLAEAPKQNVSVTERIDTEAEKIDEAIRELVENCAANIVPKLPADMKSTDGYVVCRARDDAEGEAETPDSEAAAYFVTFSYTGDNNRSVRIEVCEGGDFDSIAGSEKYKKSVVKGRDVYIALTGKGEYQANFTLGDVGFRITSVGLTQEELIYVIESLAENS